jgi:chromosomal replication initiator protein
MKVARIIADVALETGVPRRDILGDARTKHIVDARHLAMWRVRRETGMSLPAIGREFNRDHTSVLNAIRRVDAKMSERKEDA